MRDCIRLRRDFALLGNGTCNRWDDIRLGEALLWWVLGEIAIFDSLLATIPLSFVFFTIAW